MPSDLPPVGETAPDYDERALLQELEPEAGRLFDRHAKVAQEWFPHDYIPYRLGREFDKKPLSPHQPPPTGRAPTALPAGLLHHTNPPSSPPPLHSPVSYSLR